MKRRPEFLVHYAAGPAFRSLMDLSAQERDAVLARGNVRGAGRYQDPEYLPTRRRVEAALRQGFLSAGGRPVRAHPHYALMGEVQGADPRHAHRLALEALPPWLVSFTWGDSFALDPSFRAARGRSHPAIGTVFGLWELEGVLRRFPGALRPSWMELEFQLWVDPEPAWWRSP